MTKYSIIIPHHNTPKLLQRCIDSIPNSEDFQIIVVDDNSSPELVDFSNFPGVNRDNVEIYLTKEGRGAGYARNQGLVHAKGRWVLFADADDFMFEGFVNHISLYYDSDYDLVLFRANSVDSDTLSPSNRSVGINYFVDKYKAGYATEKEVALNAPVPWGKMVSRSFIVRNHIQFDEVRYANDVMFATKVACFAHKIAVSEDYIYTITMRAGSLSYDHKNNVDNFFQRLDVYIMRNVFLKAVHVDPFCLATYIISARKFGTQYQLKCFLKLLNSHTLFDGLWNLLKYEYRTKIKKQNY